MKPSKLVPALIGGGIIGLLSTLPFINLGNCFCCMWILLGGAAAAMLHARDYGPDMEFTAGDGAMAGLLAGLFGALIGTFLSTFFMVVLQIHPTREIMRRLMEIRGDLSPEFDDIITRWDQGEGMEPVFTLIGLIFSLIINAIFGTLGGLIGGSMARKKRPDNPPQS